MGYIVAYLNDSDEWETHNLVVFESREDAEEAAEESMEEYGWEDYEVTET